MECSICSIGEIIKKQNCNYFKCSYCGHETICTKVSDPFIINDPLVISEVRKIGCLEKFKLKIIEKMILEKNLLLDVGSSSGKFLYHIKDLFNSVAGIEVTNSCIKFCKEQLKMNIYSNIQDIVTQASFSVVTFWHSLEHIPIEKIHDIMQYISDHSSKETKIVISVPNATSSLYELWNKKFAFYDEVSHEHQFTKKSLDILCNKYGFIPERNFFSFCYAFFGYLQTFINLGNSQHDFLYYFLKRRRNFGLESFKLISLFLYNIFLGGVFFIPAIFGALNDFYNFNKGAVLTICYKRNH